MPPRIYADPVDVFPKGSIVCNRSSHTTQLWIVTRERGLWAGGYTLRHVSDPHEPDYLLVDMLQEELQMVQPPVTL